MDTIISLTAIPSRINGMGPCIESLLAQRLPVYVWLPRTFKRTGEGFGGKPKLLKKYERESGGQLRIALVDDQGPATKLLPALGHFKQIITADDDTVYGKGWAAGLIAAAAKNQGCCVGYRGRAFIDSEQGYRSSRIIMKPKTAKEVDILTGVHGVLYKSRWFRASITAEVAACESNDDIVFSSHLRGRGVKLLVIPQRCKITKLPTFNFQALGRINSPINDRLVKEHYHAKGP